VLLKGKILIKVEKVNNLVSPGWLFFQNVTNLQSVLFLALVMHCRHLITVHLKADLEEKSSLAH
jgi:hypothetical protein